MNLKSINIIKHPRDCVWTAVRDSLPQIVPFMDDIKSVTVTSRKEERNGNVLLVNVWRGKPKLPAVVAGHIRPEMFAWTDRAEYRNGTFECHWKMEPHFFTDRIQCSGVTHYEPAMGGQGTRVTFEANFELSTRNLPGVPSLLESTISNAANMFVSALVPKNFRKLTDAVAKHLDSLEVDSRNGKSKRG